ncbi:MAG: hypothetical protein KGD64_14545 [Candidatus Heimdallarchaeota archaeon]|nr:hypothetical protein [Candidatus Heimdallarchaeota archaeon]
MSHEVFDNPIFATNIIPRFSHDQDIDSALLDNLEMESHEDIAYAIFPIIEQVSENRRGIVRLFVTNKGERPKTIQIYYSLVGWFSDLQKVDKKNQVEKITVYPNEVWYRDIVFKSNIKQGKNYFKISFYENKKFITSNYIEYSQIREIEDVKQIERSNFLGMASKPYINPRAANYWIFYSLFGKKKYSKESAVFIVFKLVGFLAGTAFVILSVLMADVGSYPDAILPVSVIVALLSFLSFFSNLDDKYVKLIYNLKLTKDTKRGTLYLAKQISNDTLQKYCFSGINYGYDVETDALYWKEGAIKLYEKLIPLVGRLLNISTDIKPTSHTMVSRVEEIKDKDQLKKKIEEGIQLHHEEGIRFDEGVKSMGDDLEAMKTEVQVFETKTSIHPDPDIIITETSVDPDIDPIEIETTLKQEVKVIKTDSSLDAQIDPIETETKSLVSDIKGVSIGKITDLTTIPEPKKLPFVKKDDTKNSVKDKDRQK